MSTLQRPDGNYGALEAPLYGVTARLRLVRLVLFASRGALVGIALSLVALVLDDFALLPDWFQIYLFIPVVVLLAGGIGAAVGGLKRISLRSAAALVEGRLGLKERITSAMEFSQDPGILERDPEARLLLRLQQEDAVFHARMIRPSSAVPYKMPWETKALIPAVVVLLLAILLPNLLALLSPRERNEQAIVGQTGVKLIKSADQLEKEAVEHRMAETAQIAQSMRRLGQQMRHGRMDKRQAMLKMAGITKQIEDARKALNAGGGVSNPSNLPQAGQQLARELEAEKNQFGNIPGPTNPKKGSASNSNTSPTAKEISNAADSMQEDNALGLGDQLRKLANRLQTQNISPKDQKQTASDLDKLAQALQGTSLQDAKQHIQAAADALRKGDKSTAATELRKAADAIDKAMQQAQSQQQDGGGLDQADSAVQQSQDAMAKAQTPGQVNQQANNSSAGQSGKGANGKPGQNGQGNSGQGQQGQGQSGQGSQQGQSGQGQSGQGQGQSGQGQQGQGGQSGQGQSGQSGEGQSGQSGQGQSGQSGQGSSASSGTGGQSGGKSTGGGSKSSSQGSSGGSKGQGSSGHSPGTKPPSRSWDTDPHMQAAAGKFAIPPGNKSGYKGGTEAAPRMSLPSQTMGQQQSKVPYEQEVDQARRTSESAMDNEDIAPADRALVRKYYDSLAQSH